MAIIFLTLLVIVFAVACIGGILGFQAGILGNSITEMKAFSNIWL